MGGTVFGAHYLEVPPGALYSALFRRLAGAMNLELLRKLNARTFIV